MSLEFGLMSLGDLLAHPTSGKRMTEAQRHRSIVDQAILAEELGFSSIHLGEHHFSDYMLSSPPVVLAAIGERTRTLKLSTAVTLAGNLDPVRVAEDYSTVDVLSGGRVELVLGRGNLFVNTYAGFGQDIATARERYDEHVNLLVKLLREEDITWSGNFRSPLSSHTTRPRPVSTVPVWIGAGSADSAKLAADLGCWLMLPSVFGKPEMFKPIVDIYHERWSEVGRAPDKARVGACSHTYIGTNNKSARAVWEKFYQNYWQFVGNLLGNPPQWPAFDFDELLSGPGFCGSPDYIVEKIEVWRELFGLDRHLLMFDLGGMESATVMESIERFGTKVMPQLVTR